MSTTRTRTSVVPASAGGVIAAIANSDRARHPATELAGRNVYAHGYSPLGKTHPVVKVRK